MKRGEIEKMRDEAREIASQLTREYQDVCHERWNSGGKKFFETICFAEQKACARMNDAIAASNYLADAEFILDYLGFVED